MKSLPAIFISMLAVMTACEIQPRNTLEDCREQCKDSKKPGACYEFCDCIHENCQPFHVCLEEYNNAPEEDSVIIRNE